MLNKFFSLLLIVALGVLSVNCSHKNRTSENIPSIRIEVNPTEIEKINLLELLEDIKYIQLETTEDCLLKWIHKVQVFQNKLFVFNSDNSGQLFCFDLNGKFLYKIGNRGNGPGEYIYMTDFHVDKYRKCIWVGDDAHKILKYDLEGNFLTSYTTEFSIKNLLPISENKEIMAIRLGYFKNKNYSFVIYDIAEKKIIFSKGLTNDIERMIAGNAFFETQNSVLYAGMFNDTIFNLHGESLIPHVFIDFGRHTFLIESQEGNNKEIMLDFMNPKNKYAGIVQSIYENENFISFCYDYSGSGQIAIYSKNKNKTLNIKEILVKEKKIEASLFFLKFWNENQIISFLPAHLLCEEGNGNTNNRNKYGLYSEISDVLSNLQEDDNPILIFGKENFDFLFSD